MAFLGKPDFWIDFKVLPNCITCRLQPSSQANLPTPHKTCYHIFTYITHGKQIFSAFLPTPKISKLVSRNTIQTKGNE